jgi:hypothetical protein
MTVHNGELCETDISPRVVWIMNSRWLHWGWLMFRLERQGILEHAEFGQRNILENAHLKDTERNGRTVFKTNLITSECNFLVFYIKGKN